VVRASSQSLFGGILTSWDESKKKLYKKPQKILYHAAVERGARFDSRRPRSCGRCRVDDHERNYGMAPTNSIELHKLNPAQ
jgi:hypothetical protein